MSARRKNLPQEVGFRPTPDFEGAKCTTVGAPEDWFPDPHIGMRQAEMLCRYCDFIPECRAFAINNNITEGVWGGLTPRGRRSARGEEIADD